MGRKQSHLTLILEAGIMEIVLYLLITAIPALLA